MAKTLKEILEVYEPKSPDEKRFKDKHITVKTKDRNGNGDDVFRATNIKPVDRSKEGHGFNPGDDEKVYEEKMGASEKAKEKRLKKKYDSSGMKASMKKQYGKEEGEKVYFSKIRKMAMEQTELDEQLKSASQRVKDYHGNIHTLLKGIAKGTDHIKKASGDNAHWGHVGILSDIHKSLQDLHDRVHQQGEYATPMEVVKTKKAGK